MTRALKLIALTSLLLWALPAFPAVDALGDPLPEGAIQRLGTLKLRYSGSIGDLIYLADGRGVVALGKNVEIWDLATGAMEGSYPVAKGSITSLDLGPDGATLLVGEGGGMVHVWDLATHEVKQSLDTGQSALTAARYSPDGTRVLVTRSSKPRIREFELADGTQTVEIDGKMHSFHEAIYSADGRSCFVNGSAGSNEVLAHYDLESGDLLNEWVKDYYAHRRSLALSPDGERVLIGSRHSATEWLIDGYQALGKFSGHHGHAVTAVAYSGNPDELLTGSRDGSIRRWNRQQTDKPLLRWCPHNAYCTHIRVSPDGQWVLSYGSGVVAETSIETGKSRLSWDRHDGPVECVTAVPAGVLAKNQAVISGSTDETVRGWNILDGASAVTLEGANLGAYALAVAADGSRAAAGCKDGVIREYALPAGTLIRELKGHLGYIRCLAYTPDGQSLLSGAGDGRIHVWDMERDEPVRTMKEHLGGVLALGVSTDGTRLLSGGRDTTVRLWDLATGELLQTCRGHRGWVQAVGFVGDATRAASVGRDGRMLLWNLQTGEQAVEMQPGGRLSALAVTADGASLFAGGSDGLITRWDVATGEKTSQLPGHRGAVTGLALCDNDTRLVSASEDTSLLVWDVQ